MIGEASELDFIEVFDSLSQIPLSNEDGDMALKKITELGRTVLASHACTLTFVNLESKVLTQAACSGFDQDFEEHMKGKTIRRGSGQTSIDFDVISKGEMVERYGLQKGPNGIANPKTARRYNLQAGLCCPLKSGGRVIGYFNHFSSQPDRFTDHEKRLLEIFARHSVLVIERFEQLATERSSSILRELSQSLVSLTEQEYLEQLPVKACDLLRVPACVVWKLDPARRLLRVAATTGVDDDYRDLEMDAAGPSLQHLSSRGARSLPDVRAAEPTHYAHPGEARRRGWVSLLTAPMFDGERLIGMLDVYTKAKRHFEGWEKRSFEAFADFAAVSIQKAELLRQSAELLRQSEENLNSSLRLERLNRITHEITEGGNVADLLELILDGGLELVGAERGWVSRFDPTTGELNIVASRGGLRDARPLKLGVGITGKALKEERAIRADDVRAPQWHGVYEEFWADTRSELAIPILIGNAQIRVGHAVGPGTKLIGVLNVESAEPAAFSQADEDTLSSLCQQAAVIIDKLEADSKLADLRQIEREIAGKRDWDETIQVVLRAITKTLGYEYVNISLVDEELRRIRTKYVVGIPRKEVEVFRRMADHSLESGDIQAHVVRSREVEVPEVDDPRFDQKIYRRLQQDKLIRVFIPMLAAGDRVLGTVEAGYKRSFRKHIYERDVQILRGFVNYAVRALEQSKRGLLPKISHELKSPVVGIRSNASYLRQHFQMLDSGRVEMKLDDILTDCEMLILKVSELEHILGQSVAPVSKRELTLVYRDIIIKTVNQLKPLVAERGFDISGVQYNPWDLQRIKLYVDKAKLNSVVYNLLINAIKYAEDDPAEFRIMISGGETRDGLVVRFQDWGIGISKQYEEQVFEEGFRAPEARGRFVTGTGLGLTIARKAMREMGGDLRLVSNHKPTQFDLVLPRSLKEVPDDSLRG
jgi:signal transduction histidine kinase/putative methionine-R-sulfoxide reductase with GAF domain